MPAGCQRVVPASVIQPPAPATSRSCPDLFLSQRHDVVDVGNAPGRQQRRRPLPERQRQHIPPGRRLTPSGCGSLAAASVTRWGQSACTDPDSQLACSLVGVRQGKRRHWLPPRVSIVLDGDAGRRCVRRQVDDPDGWVTVIRNRVRPRIGHRVGTRIGLGPRVRI